METFLLLWFTLTTAAFIAYIIYDVKVSPRATSHVGGLSLASEVSTTTAVSGEDARRKSEDARDAEEAARYSLERLNRQINHWDWQQAVANAIASLKISGSGKIRAVGLAEPRHSFPRQMVLGRNKPPQTLTGHDLHEAVEDYHLKTKCPKVEIWKDITKQFDSFFKTRDSLREPMSIPSGGIITPIELRPDLIKKIRDVRSEYHFFNGPQPLHEDQLEQIFRNEKIEVLYIENLPLLSLFVEYTNEENEKQKAVVIREDDVHQALKEFLELHELGHWFLHFETGFAERFIGQNYYLHSSTEWQPLELDADEFAMTALFPTPYLADRENSHGTLSEEKLYEEFVRGMGEVHADLKDNMLRYIKTRVARYHQFKQTILPVRIPVASIEEPYVEALLNLSENADTEHSVNWVWMNEEFRIIRASRGFLRLFDLPQDQIIGKLTPLDLVMPEERQALIKRFEDRLDRRKAIFYFTRLTDGRRVAVYSFPILRGEDYVGSIGYLMLQEQDASGNSHSNPIHST